MSAYNSLHSNVSGSHALLCIIMRSHHRFIVSLASVTSPRFIPPSKSTSTPLKSPKRSLDRGSQATSPSPKAVRSPANLVVKKADLVTRFDVVFEDVTSGELVSRSHSGRTVKSYDSPDGAQSGTVPRKDSPSSSPESTVQDTLEAIRGGKVMSVGDWEGPVKKGKSKSCYRAEVLFCRQ